MKIIMMMVCVVIQVIYFSMAYAEDSTSLGVVFASNREKIPIRVSSDPVAYKYASSDRYNTVGPKLTMVRNIIFFEASAQALLPPSRMENVHFPSDAIELDSAYGASARVGVVIHESFIPYVNLGYSQTKGTYKGNYDAATSFSASDHNRTTHFGVGARSIIPLAKKISVYGDGVYKWSDTKSALDMFVKNIYTNRSFSTKENSSSHDSEFDIDAGFEFKPDPRIMIRTLVGIGRTKESGEPEAESISYTLGLFYIF